MAGNQDEDRLTEKKYALHEIEEPELQDLFKMSQNVFDQQVTSSEEPVSRKVSGAVLKAQEKATVLSEDGLVASTTQSHN